MDNVAASAKSISSCFSLKQTLMWYPFTHRESTSTRLTHSYRSNYVVLWMGSPLRCRYLQWESSKWWMIHFWPFPPKNNVSLMSFSWTSLAFQWHASHDDGYSFIAIRFPFFCFNHGFLLFNAFPSNSLILFECWDARPKCSNCSEPRGSAKRRPTTARNDKLKWL